MTNRTEVSISKIDVAASGRFRVVFYWKRGQAQTGLSSKNDYKKLFERLIHTVCICLLHEMLEIIQITGFGDPNDKYSEG